MESLPQELIEHICSLLTTNDLKNTLTVSRNFQHASERASGAFAEFVLTRDNVEAFTCRYSGSRSTFLHHVQFSAQLPAYDAEDRNDEDADESGKTHRCRESLRELREKDELFTKDIKFVFEAIKTLENNFPTSKIQLTIFTPVREILGVICPHRKCVSWRLHLLSPDNLPVLNSVRALRVLHPRLDVPDLETDKSLLMVDLRILVDLAIKCPQLEYLGCDLLPGNGFTSNYSSEAVRHYVDEWAGPCRDDRHDFAKALASVKLPSTLRQAQLHFLLPYPSEPIDQTREIPNLVGPASHDAFSSSLRSLSYQLRNLELTVVADATLFWPLEGEATWPNLETIRVAFHIATPSGRWYFEGPRGEGRDTKGFEVTDASYPPLEDTSDDENWDEFIDDNGLDLGTITCRQFRVFPNDEVLVPFLTAFAKATSHMPALKEAILWAPLNWNAAGVSGLEDYDGTRIAKWPGRPLAWGIAYVAPGEKGFHDSPGELHSDLRQLWWMTGQWKPSFTLAQLFQKIGDETVELLEHHDHKRYAPDQKISLREPFYHVQKFGYRHPECPWPFRIRTE